MTFKDPFFGHSQTYADARPSSPDELFEFLNSQCKHHDLVWDCATGNGHAGVPGENIEARDCDRRWC